MSLNKTTPNIKFNQSPWLKEYINKNTQFRQEATNKFEINLYKLMNNSFYGKTCEDVRKYNDVKILTKKEEIDTLILLNKYFFLFLSINRTNGI